MAPFLGIVCFVLAAILGLIATLWLQAKGELKSAEGDLERFKSISDLEKYKSDLETRLAKAKKVLPKFESLADLENHRLELESQIGELKVSANTWRQQVGEQEKHLAMLHAQADAVEERLTMQSFGVYRPKYGFEDSERYSFEIGRIRDDQKAMIKGDRATHCPQEWSVDGSAAKGRKMIKEHSKLMLRAFNGECDAAIGKVKYNNVDNLEARLNRSFEAINKLGTSKSLWITQDYYNSKLKELYLVHEHREKVEEEREEQRRIKEEMREEEKALKEIEKAKKDAEKEESQKTKALEKAKKELAEANEDQTNRLKDLVDRLEFELKEALERKAKAIARAQLTRSGHVYILSNIGSFGEGVYKIGMTRRLEPLERVNELGSASVPFRFDVHAMIYSEDAPALETKLHKYFDDRRVNLANYRKEFFRVSLEEIQDAVKENFREVTFMKEPEAEEYFRTLSLMEDEHADEMEPSWA